MEDGREPEGKGSDCLEVVTGQAIAVRRAALERKSNLTWPVTPDSHKRLKSLAPRFRRNQQHTPKSQKENPATLDVATHGRTPVAQLPSDSSRWGRGSGPAA